MFDKVLFSLFFFIPAGIANSTPVFAAKIPGLRKLEYPMDFGLKIDNKRILGSHKTMRGLVLAVTMGIFAGYLQGLAYDKFDFIQEISPNAFTDTNQLFLGGMLGLGAILGDATKSFFKRRIGVQPGKAWIPFDQVDYIFGGILFSLLAIRLDVIYYLIIFILFAVLHPISTVIGYLLKLKDEPI